MLAFYYYKKTKTILRIVTLILLALITTQCNIADVTVSNHPEGFTETPALTDTPTLAIIQPTRIPTMDPEKLKTSSAIAESTKPTAKPTPTPSPTQNTAGTKVPVVAGKIEAPILLFHQVKEIDSDSQYILSIDAFKEQMEFIKNNGYETILLSELINAIQNGGELPARPIVLTFDDGYADVIDNIFPEMEKYGFKGNLFLVTKYIDARDYLSVSQIKTLVKAGWEIGSHGMAHVDLLKKREEILNEMCRSRTTLEKQFNVKVQAFAYPYASADKNIMANLEICGYKAGFGIGMETEQIKENIRYLTRIEVHRNHTLDDFGSWLKIGDE